jgi:beta-lactamase superfamily II metal-dependent hydrolase
MRLKYCLGLLIIVLILILAGCQGTAIHSNSTPAPATLPATTPITDQPIQTAPPVQNITSPTSSSTITPTPPNSTTSKLEVYYLDVGQGDSEILRYGNSTMLIDAGTNASTNTLISDFKKLGISKFDVVVGTHPHEDHIV